MKNVKPNRRTYKRFESDRESMLYIRRIPVDLKFQFKAFCARRGRSMSDWIMEQMQEAIKQDAAIAEGRRR